jgi:ankyrin repeat protein
MILLERGANIQAKDKYGNTALIAAACECALATMNSTYDIVKLLLQKGADVNGRTHEGRTALMNAAFGFGDASILKLLLDSGADPTAKDKHGDTALALAVKSERPDKVQLLKQATGHTR